MVVAQAPEILVLSGSDAWIARIDRDGRLVASSGASAPMPEGEVLRERLTPDSQAAYDAAMTDLWDSGLRHRLDLELDLLSNRIVFDAALSRTDGQVLLVALDVTEDRHERARLRESERILRDAEGITHLGTWYWDVAEPHVHWSKELYNIYGLDPESHTPTYDDYLDRVHPDDVDRVKQAMERAMRDHEPFSHDERIRRADDQWRFLHTWGRPLLSEAGELEALLGVCMDITDRKNAELAVEDSQVRYRAVFDHSADALAILDRAGRVRSANRTLQDWAGRSEDDLRTRRLAGLVAPEDSDAVVAGLEVVDAGPVQEAVSLHGHPVQLTLAALPNDEILAVLTEQHPESEGDEDAHRIEELEQETAWKTRILQVAGHELKNPLTPILLNLHAIKARAHLDDKDAAILERISEQVKRLMRMVHDFGDMAGIQEGEAVIHRTRFELEGLVKEVFADLRDAADAKNVELALIGRTGRVEADRDRLRQVLENLIDNAIRFTPEDSTVTVHLRPDPRVEVLDEGPGVPAEALPDLFKPFGTVDARRMDTGLGLYMCKVIMEAHGGKVGAEVGPPGYFWIKWGNP